MGEGSDVVFEVLPQEYSFPLCAVFAKLLEPLLEFIGDLVFESVGLDCSQSLIS